MLVLFVAAVGGLAYLAHKDPSYKGGTRSISRS